MSRVLVTEPPAGTHPRVLARHADQDLRTVFLVARPETRGLTFLAPDLLGALGARDDVAGRSASSGDDRAHVVVWLVAHRTQTVVVASPQPLPDTSLDALCSLTVAAGTDLVLACDTGHAAMTARRLTGRAAQTVPWDEMLALLPDPVVTERPAPSPDPVEWDPHLTVPRSDFTSYRDDCRRLLTPERFADIDRLYVDTARQVRDEPTEPTEQNVVDTIARRLDKCRSLDAGITVLRATQAGLYERGWYLSADLNMVIGRLVREDRGVPLTDSQWRSIRAYRSPTRAACCALNALGKSNAEILAVRVAETDDDSALLGTAPPLALPYLRGQRLLRYSEGAGPHDLLIDAKNAAVCAAHRDARKELRLPLANHVASTDRARTARFRANLGLQMFDVAGAGRASR